MQDVTIDLGALKVAKAKTWAEKTTKAGNSRPRKSKMRVFHILDVRNFDVKPEVDWPEYLALKAQSEIKTKVVRLDKREKKEDGTENGRWGKNYADMHSKWNIVIYKTNKKRVGKFKVFCKGINREPLVAEMSQIYALMYSYGIHPTYVHANTGMCKRGKPLELSNVVETHEEAVARFEESYTEATCGIEMTILKYWTEKFGVIQGAKLARPRIRQALKKPVANPINLYGYGRKKIIPGVNGSPDKVEYVLSLDHKYGTDKKPASKKKGNGGGGGGGFTSKDHSTVVRDVCREERYESGEKPRPKEFKDKYGYGTLADRLTSAVMQTMEK